MSNLAISAKDSMIQGCPVKCLKYSLRIMFNIPPLWKSSNGKKNKIARGEI